MKYIVVFLFSVFAIGMADNCSTLPCNQGENILTCVDRVRHCTSTEILQDGTMCNISAATQLYEAGDTRGFMHSVQDLDIVAESGEEAELKEILTSYKANPTVFNNEKRVYDLIIFVFHSAMPTWEEENSCSWQDDAWGCNSNVTYQHCEQVSSQWQCTDELIGDDRSEHCTGLYTKYAVGEHAAPHSSENQEDKIDAMGILAIVLSSTVAVLLLVIGALYFINKKKPEDEEGGGPEYIPVDEEEMGLKNIRF